MRGEKETLACAHCGLEFERFKAITKLAARHYCSRACSDAAKRTAKEKTCPVCGNTFTVRPAQEAKGLGKYCSRRCFGRSKSGVDNPAWVGGLQRRNCALCGKEFRAHAGSSQKFCSQRCGVGGRRKI